MTVPDWLKDLWTRVTLWIRVPPKNRTKETIERVIRKSLTRKGFAVHRVGIDYNASQNKFYVRPVISGTCKSTRACVEILVRGRAGEICLDTGVFVYQRDNTCDEPLFDRIHCERRRIKPLRQTCDQDDSGNRTAPLYSMVVLPPKGHAKRSSSKTVSSHAQEPPHGDLGARTPQSLPFCSDGWTRIVPRVHKEIRKSTQNTTAYRTTCSDGRGSKRRRDIHAARSQMRYHRSSGRRTLFPLCSGRRIVSAVC